LFKEKGWIDDDTNQVINDDCLYPVVRLELSRCYKVDVLFVDSDTFL